MAKKEIKNICISISIKNKNSPKKLNRELEKLKKFVSGCDLFRNKKREIKTLINKFKVKEK